MKNSSEPAFGCVIMASGLGKRFGGNKLMAPFLGRPLICRALEITRGLFARRVVVTRHPEVVELCRRMEVPVVFHDLPDRNDTVRLGLEAVGRDLDGCLFCMADQPMLSRRSIQAMLRAAKMEPEKMIRLADGSPVLFPKDKFSELMTLPQGKGGNVLLRRYPELVQSVPAAWPEETQDIDQPEELARLEAIAKRQLSLLLDIPRGITAVIGGGGKTTLIHTLAEELSRRGSVIIATSTKIFPPPYPVVPAADAEALREHPILCVAREAAEGKLAAPEQSFSELGELADFVLVEADGSKHLPLKAHEAHEPVIPEGTRKTICVVGIDGIGKPIQDACHRSARYAALCGCEEDEPVTVQRAARVLEAEKLQELVYINKVETEEEARLAKDLAGQLSCKVVAGSLRKGEYTCLR